MTVALVGDGGDESFAGYERYAAMGLADRVPASARGAAGAPAAARRCPPDGASGARRCSARARFLEAAAVPRAERYGQLMQVFTLDERAALWTDDAKAEIGALMSPGFLLGPAPATGIAGLQLLDLATYLPGDLLPKSDIASMAHSLELRSPLLDHRVVELGLSLPDSLKFHGREGKVALRRAFADELPPPVAETRQDRLRRSARPLVPRRAAPARARAPARRARALARLVPPRAVERLLDEHAPGARTTATASGRS